ncbi:formylglycine-generating enzyme family protein [Paenibacillus sp. NPDC058177]|uniref:formylglycine-generating enzyme family protein n=1 Tax=Paenibacillus sp. NPDC058177 TaxID=3346369 RepID=UPI0036DAD84F
MNHPIPKACCSVSRQHTNDKLIQAAEPVATPCTLSAPSSLRFDWVSLTGGAFEMGTNDSEGFPDDGEGPARKIEIDPFYISAYTVTNAQYQAFVEATGYITEAEKFGWSYVFHLLVSEETRSKVKGSSQQAPWWLAVEGANWRRPEGIEIGITDRMDHPVVHVTWNDAIAFCKWSGTRLPSEAEWEYAARGGLKGKRYPWGDKLKLDDQHMCNIWQGKFPVKNHASDGYIDTAPVHTFEPNGYGLYQVAGNVWEWCADWFSPAYHQKTQNVNPIFNIDTGHKSMRGGSYLCHRSYCNRYRVAARSSNTPDSSSGHCGFRVAMHA